MPENLVRRPWLVLLVAVCLAYGVSVAGTFVYDDLHAVRDNTAIRSLGNIPRFFWDLDAFSALENRMYRPMLLVTYAIDHALGGGAAWMFKLTSLAIHWAVALALFHLARRLSVPHGAALGAAAVFAVHPLGSEAINTVSGRSELLLALGLVCGVLSHLRARGDLRWAAATALAAAVACGSKETGIVLPALLFAVDPPWAARGRLRRWLVAHGLPLAVVIGYLGARRALFGVATASLPEFSGGAEVMAGHGRDLLTQACTMATLLPRALAQCIVPVGLTLDPDVEFLRTPDLRVVAGWTFVVALTWLGLRRWREAPVRAFGTMLAWSTALPWIVLPLNSPYLEHRMYGPLAGLALVLAACWPRLPVRAPARVAIATGLCTVFAVAAAARSLEYRSARTLWERVVREQPGSVRGLCGLALCHMEAGALAAALPLVQRAVAIWPDHAAALRNLAELHILTGPAPGNAMVAVVAADRLVAMHPRNPFDRLLASRALAAAGLATGEAWWFDAAEAAALHCLEIAPPKGLVYRTAASARAQQGRLDLAIALLDRSVASGLAHSSVLLDRAGYLRGLGRHAEADRDLERAAREAPFDPRVLEMLAPRRAVPPR